MKHVEGKFGAFDGLELYFQKWVPDGDPRANLAFVHGIGGHCGQSTYTHLIEYLVPLGYSLYGFDLRGHGRSDGRRGSIDKWGDYRGDLKAFLQLIRGSEPNSTVFILGQSLGGLIVLDYALHYPQDAQGVIASAPALIEPNIPPALVLLLKALSPFWPHLALSSKLDATGVSRDPAEVEKVISDPVLNLKLSPRLTTETLKALERTQAQAADLQVPLLLIHGTADPLTPAKGSQEFFAKVTFEDKTLKLYEGGYHQAFIDINREQVFADLSQWLSQHLP